MNEHSSGTRATVPPSIDWHRKPPTDVRTVGDAMRSAEMKRKELPHVVQVYARDWDTVILTDEIERLRKLLATGTDSTRSGDQIKPGVPDQGSVRNATDREQCLAKIHEWHDWAKRIAKSDTHDARSKDVAIIEMNVLFHLAEEIRALPDQKD